MDPDLRCHPAPAPAIGGWASTGGNPEATGRTPRTTEWSELPEFPSSGVGYEDVEEAGKFLGSAYPERDPQMSHLRTFKAQPCQLHPIVGYQRPVFLIRGDGPTLVSARMS